MPAYSTYSGVVPSSRSSRPTVQEEYQWTRSRPPQHNQENVPSGQTGGSPDEPADGLARELSSMAVSGQIDDDAAFDPLLDYSSSAHPGGPIHLTPNTYQRPDVVMAALTQPLDPTNFPLTSETLWILNRQHDGGSNVPYYPGTYSNRVTSSYVPLGHAQELSESMEIPRRTWSDTSWVMVPIPEPARLDSIAETTRGTGAMFCDEPVETDWDEDLLVQDNVYELSPPPPPSTTTTRRRQKSNS